MKKSKSLLALLSLVLVSAAAGCSGPATSSAAPSSNIPSSNIPSSVPSSVPSSNIPSSATSSVLPTTYPAFIGDPLTLDPVTYAMSCLPKDLSDPFIQGWIGGIVSQTCKECIGEGDIKIKRFSFQYESLDIDDNVIALSGAITIPYLDGHPAPNSVEFDSHPTFTDASESVMNGPDIYSALTCVGAIVIEADLIGFGLTEEYPADYHCRHLSDRNSVDAILAARTLIKNNLGINFDKLPQFFTGYSQGGYDSLSLLRYMETEATAQEKEIIHPFATYCGSGAYDIGVMIHESLSNPDFRYPEYVLMGLLTAQVYHPDFFEGHSIDEFLTPYGLRFVEPVVSKNDEAIQALKAEKTDVSNLNAEFFSSEFLNNEESPLWEIADRYCEEENLLDGKWMPESIVNFFYSVDDEMVTPKCSMKASELFSKLENVTFFTGHGEHKSYALYYYIDVLDMLRDSPIFPEEE